MNELSSGTSWTPHSLRPRLTLKLVALLMGPILACGVGFAMSAMAWPLMACLTGGLTTLCVLWWVFEPIPIPATSLIPLGAFPLVGILSAGQIADAYGSPLILLIMGGAMLSKAMEKSGAHRRLALGMVRVCGSEHSRSLVFGFMAASAFLSMWISNTATTLMLLPIALAVIEKSSDQQLALPLLLGIAYAASIGGLGTPIGTPPNVLFLSFYQEFTGKNISFFQWMQWAIPVVVIFVPIVALWLTRNLQAGKGVAIEAPGPWRVEESRTLWIFALTALAWMTMKEPWGGWSGLLNITTVNYASVALVAVVLMFLCPNGKGGALLDWSSASHINWGVLLLFAGGIAIAKAFKVTGLSASLGDMLGGIAALPLVVVVGAICLLVTFLTEVTSNVATATLLLPILAAAALSEQIAPELLMVPAAMSASCAFMLPVATAPNAIVFGAGQFSVRTMAREGVILNLVGVVVITLVIVGLGA